MVSTFFDKVTFEPIASPSIRFGEKDSFEKTMNAEFPIV